MVHLVINYAVVPYTIMEWLKQVYSHLTSIFLYITIDMGDY